MNQWLHVIIGWVLVFVPVLTWFGLYPPPHSFCLCLFQQYLILLSKRIPLFFCSEYHSFLFFQCILLLGVLICGPVYLDGKRVLNYQITSFHVTVTKHCFLHLRHELL